MEQRPLPANNPAGEQQATQWFCHECGWEGTPLRAPYPTCARCQGSFVEEISPADDPREFDQEDDDAQVALEFDDGQGGPAFRFVLGGGVAALAGGGGGAVDNAGGAPPPNVPGNPLTALMQALGWNPAVVGGAPPAGAGQQQAQAEADFPDPDDEPLGGGGGGGASGQQGGAARQGGAGQVPIRNLATFLGEAFGAPAPHPADHPRNNPFAEGGHDGAEGDDDDHQPQPPGAQAPPPNDPFAALAAAAAGGGQGGGLNYLVGLLNALGGGMQPMAGARGDYVFGEGAFQNLLNDLLQQQAGHAGPQPAPEDKIAELPRRTVDREFLDSPDNHDCVICQDPFTLSETLLTLPCKHHHAFHEACIVPWLQNSGTCPTCRFALVPQPDPVTGVLPGQEGNAEAGGNTHAEAAICPEARAGEAAARRAAAAAVDRTGEGEQGGSMMSGMEAEEGEASLPGSWPTTEAERSRASSRARGRERAQREAHGEAHGEAQGELPYDDLD